jgi:hypothetical protein
VPILEIPLIVQDLAILNPSKGMRIDSKMALCYILLIAEEVEKVGGVPALLWHPNEIISRQSWRLYIKILNYLRKKMLGLPHCKKLGVGG